MTSYLIIPDLLFIFLAIFMLQFYNFAQTAMTSGRSVEFVLIACLYALYAICIGKEFPLDGITLGAGLILGIMFLSLLWTDSRRSVFEVITWASYFLLFMVCRTVPVTITLSITLACATIFAGMQIYEQARPKTTEAAKKAAFNHWSRMYVFGNNNHNGAYLMFHVPVGLYLTVNGYPWAAPLTALIAVAVVLTRCYGSLLGLGASLAAMLVYTYGWWMLLIIVAAIFCFLPMPIIAHDHRLPLISDNKAASFKHRVLLWYQAWLLIRQKWCFGWGMDMYRKVLPFVAPEARRNKTADTWIKDIGGMEQNKSHRVHNDHLEIIVELGLVGYLAFVWFFCQFTPSLLFVGVIIALAVNALVFFPLRETHIAASFWAILGCAAFSVPTLMVMPVIVKFALVGAVFAILAICHRKFLALYHYDRAVQSSEIADKQKFIQRALQFDPYNGQYLNAAAYVFPQGSIERYDAASRSMRHYDGDGVMWHTWEQYARAIVEVNHLGAAHAALTTALYIDPEYVPAIGMKAEIEAFYAQQMQPPPEPAPFRPIKVVRPIKRRK
jgi:O-antigen ligase